MAAENDTPRPRSAGPRKPRQRKSRPSPTVLENLYNPGQVALLMDLLREFSGHVEVDLKKQDGALTVKVQSDLPHLESFIGFKIRDLVSQQSRLAQLWEMSEAG